MLDPENPRLPEGQSSQPETIHAVLRAEGPKTLALARSIAAEGLSPMDLLLVTPAPDSSKRFVVREGNRRVTALKILAEPALAEAVLTDSQIKNLRKWSSTYRARGELETAPCVIFDTKEEVDPWIVRRHRGDQGGVGVVRWGATESARFDARRSGKASPELQVLEFVGRPGRLDAETRGKLRDVSITNLKRLLRAKEVRKRIGLTLGTDGRLDRVYPEAEVLKGLRRIVRDLAFDRIKASDIYTSENRKAYLDRFKSSERPSPEKILPAEEPLSGKPKEGGDGRSHAKTHTRAPKHRSTLIPSTCSCDVKGAKLRNIFAELRRLKLEHYPNAISVLLRVFLELSVCS